MMPPGRPSIAKSVFAFAEFTFDSDTGTLTRKNRESRLPEQTARLLEVLLERANTLVSREELRQVLWPNQEFLDYDQGINVAVNRLRQALREDSRNPQFLKTIPKRGYSFSADVRLVPPSSNNMPGALGGEAIGSDRETVIVSSSTEAASADVLTSIATAPEAPSFPSSFTSTDRFIPLLENIRVRSGRRRTWLIGLLAITIVSAAAWVFYLVHPQKTAPHALRLGIAPVRVQGDAQANDVGDAFQLELSDAISKLPRVQVPAAGAFATSNALDIPRISRELNLDDLLLGTMAKQGDHYDLRFELVRAADATHLASFEYSGLKKDLPALCERLQQDVFHYLQSNATVLQTIKGSTNDAQAYDLYLRGVYHTIERDPDSLNQSVTEFHQAIERDPNFAAAYAGMATAYLKLSIFDSNPHHGLLNKSESFAQQAVKLDPQLAEPHAVLGSTAYKLDRDFARGEAELRTAIRLDSTQAAYRDWLAVLLVEEGRFDEALDQINLAHTTAPFLPSVYAMESLVAVYARRNATAIAAARKYVSLLPDLPIAHNTLAWVYFETRHYKDAIDEWRQMALLQHDNARVELENRGMDILKSNGIRAYARLRLDAIGKKQATAQFNDFMPAEWHACAGNRDQAIAELEKLEPSRDAFMLHVGVDPLFDSLHGDPRFLSLLSKAGVFVPPGLQNVNSHLCQ
jgi:DNA-binding winged helix-turn-helix (wHTH) protein/tetratricopeptide (TPR) repeat protein